jgi:hypothetical protein
MPATGINPPKETQMNLKSAIAALFVALSFSVPVWADTPSSDAPYLQTDANGRSTMP